MQRSEWNAIRWSHTHCNFLCTSSLVNWSRYTCASSWLLYMESCHIRRWLPCSAGESRSRPVVSFPWFDNKVWCDPSTSGIMYHYVTLLCYLPVDSCIMRPYASYTRKFFFKDRQIWITILSWIRGMSPALKPRVSSWKILDLPLNSFQTPCHTAGPINPSSFLILFSDHSTYS